MFECESNWDGEDGGLSEALFGNSKLNKDFKIALKATSDNDDNEEKLSRKKWRARQKNKRRAKKRNQNNNIDIEPSNDIEQKMSTDIEPKFSNDIKPKLSSESKAEVILETKNKEQGIKTVKKGATNFVNQPLKPADNQAVLNKQKKLNKTKPNKPKLSKKQALKRKRLLALFADKTNKAKTIEPSESKKLKLNDANPTRTSPNENKVVPKLIVKKDSKNETLKDKLTIKLQGSRFRFINQQMYSCPSKDTVKLLKNDPESFSVYHKGFLAQVAKWPVNPLDVIIKWIKARSAKLVVADFGCGEAFLAQSVKNKVHSFDLVALNKHVTVADISNVPLENGSIDVVVFCLSLMGTNMADFIYEANRVLKHKGIMKIAEVESRFNGPKRFINDIKRFGFTLLKKDTSNSYFHTFDFAKTKNVGKDGSGQGIEHAGLILKPCLYKKR